MTFLVCVVDLAAGSMASERHIGQFERMEDAVAAARKAVDAALDAAYVPGMTDVQLLAHYEASSRVPYIFRDDDATVNAGSFNHYQYAKKRCAEICVISK